MWCGTERLGDISVSARALRALARNSEDGEITYAGDIQDGFVNKVRALPTDTPPSHRTSSFL